MNASNPYLPLVHRTLPRLLALYNADPTDPMAGCGDRRYWAWKLVDFPNATFQGAAFGLAHLVRARLLPTSMAPESIVARIRQMIAVVPKLADRRGGLAEALPLEGSFCVTGLVLSDCLGALQALKGVLDEADRQQLADGLAPLAEFLVRQDEHHGIISNHLATTALGMVRWANHSGDAAAMDRAQLWIERIRAHASPEGWMREYGGADPGYQSWCSSALAQIDAETDRFELMPLLERSYGFLEAFAFPDGRFANGCGARMTRFLFAGGAEMCAPRLPAAARLAGFARETLPGGGSVTLDAIDEPNLAPLFNDTVLAAVHWDGSTPAPRTIASRDFPEARLHLRAVGAGRVLAVNAWRGGWVCAAGGAPTSLHPEPLAQDRAGRLYVAVRGQVTAEAEGVLIVESDLVRLSRMQQGPGKFILLRLLALTAFRSLTLGNLVKRVLSRLLVTGEGRTVGRVRRRIALDSGFVTDEIVDGAFTTVPAEPGFSPFHMASQGYWQAGDDTQA